MNTEKENGNKEVEEMSNKKIEEIVVEQLLKKSAIISVKKTYSREEIEKVIATKKQVLCKEEIEKLIYDTAETLSIQMEIGDCEDRFGNYSFSILYKTRSLTKVN